jgi:hypothetical protein
MPAQTDLGLISSAAPPSDRYAAQSEPLTFERPQPRIGEKYLPWGFPCRGLLRDSQTSRVSYDSSVCGEPQQFGQVPEGTVRQALFRPIEHECAVERSNAGMLTLVVFDIHSTPLILNPQTRPDLCMPRNPVHNPADGGTGPRAHRPRPGCATRVYLQPLGDKCSNTLASGKSKS